MSSFARGFAEDGGCYNLVYVLEQEKIMIHPFAMISADITAGLVMSDIVRFMIHIP